MWLQVDPQITAPPAVASFALIFQYAANALAVAVAVGAFGFLWRTNGDIRSISSELRVLTKNTDNIVTSVDRLSGEVRKISEDHRENTVTIRQHEEAIKELKQDRRTWTRRADDRLLHEDDQ